MPQLEDAALPAQLALCLAPSIGPKTARLLIESCGSPEAVWQEKKENLLRIKGMGRILVSALNEKKLFLQAEKEIRAMEKHEIKPLYFLEPSYPQRLRECPDAPILLYTQGEKGLNTRYALSVVGTRGATAYGRDQCRKLIFDLKELIGPFTVISGLAYGIDIMAHRAALEVSIPTVAVLAHGLHMLYPRIHQKSAERIRNEGALLSDFTTSIKPERNNFLRRNRIIAGLSEGTLVVESAENGGALITAGMALQYFREVMALPGRASDTRSRGCNHLIAKGGAALVESATDIALNLGWITERPATEPKEFIPPLALSKEERKLLELVRTQEALTPDELCRTSGLPIQKVLSCLTEMELKQWLSIGPGRQCYPGLLFPLKIS